MYDTNENYFQMTDNKYMIALWKLSRTVLSRAESYLGQCWVELKAIQDSAESSWKLSRTVLSPAKDCPGQCWVELKAIQDSAESSW